METHQLKEAGLLTSTAVARLLGIGTTTLRRLEGTLFEHVPRQGTRKMRMFTPEQVEILRKVLREETRLGPKPQLVGIEELARRAACSMQTIRKRLGTELPAGRKLSHEPRAKWVPRRRVMGPPPLRVMGPGGDDVIGLDCR
ncbi:MerR family transcriptional regulator [Sorangium sp. So ce341]|uniref:MerR family transcriptional regulator n=1 Tax=Sorangium sp. So ce341 TaxID=3133302 RepID=UPI003F5E51B0